jgi:membrane-bound lytic murein transglycosylase D
VPKGFELRLPATLAAAPRQAFAGIPATARFAQQRPDQYHRVRSGDTLSQIAERYHVSLAALVRANGLSSSNFIRVGQTLTLPTSAGATPAALASADAAVDAADGYVVRRGDTIDIIARKLGASRESLLAANNIVDANRIYVGQALRVPGAAETTDVVVASASAPTVPVATTQASTVALAAVTMPTRNQITLESAANQIALEPDVAAAAVTISPALLTVTDDASEAIDSPSDVNTPEPVELGADPSDYSVAMDDTIEVQEIETLGHYADWLGIPTQRLRDRNGLRYGQPVIVGRRIELDFSVIDRATFEQRRLAFHQTLQEQFFSNHHIEDVTDHVVRRGESLWLLAQQRYNVPVWLLRQYNPDLDFDRIAPGVVIKFPTLRRIGPNGA